MRYLQRILYLTTQFFCIDPKHRTPRWTEYPSEDVCREVVIFSRKVLKDRLQLPWMATGAVPVRIRTATHFSLENSHRETSHRGRTFRSPWAFVASSLNLNLQNNNIRAFHIIGEVIHSSGGESQDLRTENGIGDILHDAGGLAVAQCHICADRIEDDAL